MCATVGERWLIYANILLRCCRVIFKMSDKHTVFFSYKHNYSVYLLVDNADLKQQSSLFDVMMYRRGYTYSKNKKCKKNTYVSPSSFQGAAILTSHSAIFFVDPLLQQFQCLFNTEYSERPLSNNGSPNFIRGIILSFSLLDIYIKLKHEQIPNCFFKFTRHFHHKFKDDIGTTI